MSQVKHVHRGFGHWALFYRGMADYLDGLNRFVEGGQASAQPVMIALPEDKLDLVRSSLRSTEGVEFIDMCGLGRNPGRVIPSMIEFAVEQDGGTSRVISDLHWPGRSDSEQAEVARHDALLTVATELYPVKLLCPIDLTSASTDAIEAAWKSHAEVIVEGVVTRSDWHEPWPQIYLDGAWPLSNAPHELIVGHLTFAALSGLRRVVQERAMAAGLPEARVEDAVLAVSEAASNSIQHGGGKGVMSLWREASGELVFEIRDSGRIHDPLVGRYPPGPGLNARGLWLVNQLADLVQIRSGEAGTVVRMTFQP